MSVGILNTALSGLAAFQRSLETTSNNISNVNTEGYSRQKVEFATRPEQYLGGNFIGSGVAVANISRIYDQFVTGQVRSSSSTFGEVDKYYSMATQIDNITANESTSLLPPIKSFFNAVHEVADDPTSIPARQAMLAEADSMVYGFNTMVERFATVRDQVNNDMGNMVADINNYASEIAKLNVNIVADLGRSTGTQEPNELMDQRDALLTKISKIIDVSVVKQQDGTVSVFIGKGQSLVMSDHATTLSIADSTDDINHKEIMMDGQIITRQLSGGNLYGSLRFRDEVLDPAQQQIGLLAAGLAITFNDLHDNGFDLQGVAGGSFFSLDSATSLIPNSIPVVTKTKVPATTAAVSATYQMTQAGASALVASDFQLNITATGYTLTQLSNNAQTSVVATIPALAAPTSTGFGFDLDLTDAALANGDSFLIRPTYFAAENLKLVLTDPTEIAAAQANVTDPGPPVTISGLPGDNRNALALAGLETSNNMLGGKFTFNEMYGQMVSKVGTQTHGAKVSRSAQETLLNQATASWESVSGVNLDEEAANLIKFQQSYQASAQAISLANTLFDSLLGAVR